MKRSISWLFGYMALLTLWVGSAQAQLIPANPPYTLQDVNPRVSDTIKLKINTYTTPRVDFNVAKVNCPNDGTTIGSLAFQYATYTGDFTGGAGNSFGGAIINGGFKSNGTCKVQDGYTYRWLQYIDVTGKDETTHKVDGDPLYPNFTMAGFDATLFDAPGRGPLSTVFTDVTWRAESALVCVNTAKKDIKVIGSFLWGFNIVTDNPPVGPPFTTVTDFSPRLWGNATQHFYDGFKAEFGATGTNPDKGWMIAAGCCCVPEPSSFAGCTLFVCMVVVMVRRRSSSGQRAYRSGNVAV